MDGAFSFIRICMAAALLLSVPIVRASDNTDAVLSASARIPSQVAPTEQVEYFWSKPAGAGPFPLVVFLHGHQEEGEARIGGKAFVNWGVLDQTARSGMVAVSVSQPGYGGSGGAMDMCGPRSQAAVATVLAHFRKQPFVDAKRTAIEGISCGATVAAKVATRDPDLAAVVLIGGAYDFEALYQDRCSSLRGKAESLISGTLCWNLENQMSPTKPGFAERSTVGFTQSVKAAVLILHGAEDPRSPVEQARRLEQGLKQSGVRVESKIFPDAGHQVPLRERAPIIDAFLRRAFTRP